MTFSIRSRLLDRRTVLRGLGVQVALPLLEGMVTEGGRLFPAAHAASTPMRFIAWFVGNGTRMRLWNPPAGTEDQLLTAQLLTPALEPLRPVSGQPNVLGDITWITGLNHRPSGLGAHDGCFALHGGPPVSNPGVSGYPVPGNATVDQMVANSQKNATARSSLVVSNDEIFGNNITNWSNISFSADGRPVQPERNLRAMFDSLFGAPKGDPTAPIAAARRKSLLDFVKDDSRRLQIKLGAADRRRIDEHLTAIASLERQVDASASSTCEPGSMNLNYGSGDFIKRGRLMMDMIIMGLKCDITRSVSFVYENADGQYTWPGVPNWKDHDASHDADDDVILNITRQKVAEFVYLVRGLKAVQELDGTLLDHSIALYCSEIGQGNQHDTSDITTMLAGRGGGLNPGRYLARSGSMYNDMLCSLLNYAGVSTKTFGVNGRGPLSGL